MLSEKSLEKCLHNFMANSMRQLQTKENKINHWLKTSHE